MSKITIINSANIFALNLLNGIKGYKKIVAGDLFNSRKSLLYTLNKVKNYPQNKQISFSHININSTALLEESIKGSETVLFFSHDYFSLVTDKNEQMLNASNISKAHGVKNFVAVTPLEFINFKSMGLNENPVEELNQVHQKVLDTNENAIVVQPDLIFGSRSYLIKFLMQSWAQSYQYIHSETYKNTKFSPM